MRRMLSRRMAIAALVVAMAVLHVPLVPAGANTGKVFDGSVSPATANVGTTQAFTVTITNRNSQQQLGSANVRPPAGFRLMPAVRSSRGDAQVRNNVLELRNLGLAFEQSVVVELEAAVPCTVGTLSWEVEAKQANNFSGPPGNTYNPNPLLLPVTASGQCAVRFVDHPADAQAGFDLTSVPADPAGAPVSVEFVGADGQRATTATGTIELALGTVPSEAAKAVLSGTVSRAAIGGLATFPGIRIDKWGLGFTLTAAAQGGSTDPVHSNPFRVWEQITTCEQDTACTSSASRSRSMSVSVDGTSSTNGAILVSIGARQIDCGFTGLNHAPQAATVDTVNFEGAKTATITIDRAVVQVTPNNGVAFYGVCFQGDDVRNEKTGQLEPADPRLLDACSASPAPCMLSRTKTGRGDVIMKIQLPPEDPHFR